MAGAVFQGNHLNGVDAKGRMSIPAAFRDAVQAISGEKRVVLLPHRGLKPCLIGYDTTRAAAINAAQEEKYTADDVSDEEDIGRLRAFALAHNVAYEDTGRIVLPEDLRDHAEIEDLALLLAAGNSFQVWNPDLFLSENDDPLLVKFVRRKLEKAREKLGGAK
ncbi:MAG: cell division/cell wall cluster transcriptional repressor MraZ [Pseudomonadota bacterium]